MIQRHELTAAEMDDRLARNRDRLLKPYYQMPEVFQSPDADWPGDKEGRALLAFVSHYKATGYSNPCMEQMLEALPAHTNAQLYFGPDACGEIFEQQLSGHSWLLRGLCEHYEQFGRLLAPGTGIRDRGAVPADSRTLRGVSRGARRA